MFLIQSLFFSKFAAFLKAVTGGILREKLFLEISQNSQENICARASFLIKLQVLGR